MSDLFDLLGTEIVGFLAASFFTVFGGFLVGLFRNFLQKRTRRNLMNFFGDTIFEEKNIALTIPVFKPRTYNDFLIDDLNDECDKNKQISWVRKKYISHQQTITFQEVPMYSDTIVIDDYYGLEKVKEFLVTHKIESILKSDDELIGEWDKYPCIISIAGPRSNQKQRENLTQLTSLQQLIEVDDSSPDLDKFVFTFHPPGKSFKLSVTKEKALGIIYRAANPLHPSETIFGIFGCRGESGNTACKFFKDNFNKIRKLSKHKPEIFILGIKGKKYEIATLLYYLSPKKGNVLNETELNQYLVE